MSKIIKTEICQQEEARLNACYKTALGVVTDIIGKEEIEEYLNGVITLKIVYNNPMWLGCARKYVDYGYSVIRVNHLLLQFDDHTVIETLIHEILHLLLNTYQHNEKWQYYANLINENTDYKITQYFTDKRFLQYRRYNIICSQCGNMIDYRNRLHKTTKEYYLSGIVLCPECSNSRLYIIDNYINAAYSKERPY